MYLDLRDELRGTCSGVAVAVGGGLTGIALVSDEEGHRHAQQQQEQHDSNHQAGDHGAGELARGVAATQVVLDVDLVDGGSSERGATRGKGRDQSVHVDDARGRVGGHGSLQQRTQRGKRLGVVVHHHSVLHVAGVSGGQHTAVEGSLVHLHLDLSDRRLTDAHDSGQDLLKNTVVGCGLVIVLNRVDVVKDLDAKRRAVRMMDEQ